MSESNTNPSAPVDSTRLVACRTGRHWWDSSSDAEKCCNGYKRTLVINGGANQQICGGVRVGRGWEKVPTE